METEDAKEKIMARILAVDDDPYFLLSLDNFLTYKNHEVITVTNPHIATNLIKSKPFDCLLLDIQMPGHNGLDLLKEIHRMCPDLAIIVVSGFTLPELEQTISRLGAVAFLEKPFDPDELLELIERHTLSHPLPN